jgi:hypothetical protein
MARKRRAPSDRLCRDLADAPRSAARSHRTTKPHRRQGLCRLGRGHTTSSLFQPLTYQVGAGALSAGEVAYPLRATFKRNRNVRVLLIRWSFNFATRGCGARLITEGWTTRRATAEEPTHAVRRRVA